MSIQTAGQEGEKDAAKAPELVMVKWKDDNNLIVTGSLKNFDDSTKPVSYLYTLPRWGVIPAAFPTALSRTVGGRTGGTVCSVCPAGKPHGSQKRAAWQYPLTEST